ncbi:TonB-dependent receptor [Algoriphagus sediminis]|uniref:TonB-dependent receptor n=1 Tax=Algoriphagus sediminis TaxID=3057113 RepID=A0ABT7YF91_9BACT|nr:TonB-dependent receptor [Algoriphagus sediminis]MDN3205189.1 TonB-dependent receptor [Algoriphagus sediminis]
MFRISLIKITITAFLSLSPLLLWSADRIKVVDAEGKPIVHALIQVDNQKPVPVNAQGEFDIQSRNSEDRILVFAMGYETMVLSAEEYDALSVITLEPNQEALDEVVVSATRTDRSVEDLPMPVTVLSQEKIQETGGIRLSDVLREQTGLQITSEHGSNLQMQGLDSDYILILLDGEPLVGRTAGTFDLDRISVSNIERIEILRGPSSAIYGSEAMAGVINIITKSGTQPKTLNLGARYRSFNSWNPYAELGINQGNWKIDALYDYFQTDGFDLTPEVVGQTQNPYDAQTAQVKISGDISEKLELSLFARGYLENATGALEVNAGDPNQRLVSLDNQLRDWNFNPTIRFKPNEKWLLSLRGMSNWYSTLADSRIQNSEEVFDLQGFDQFFHRTELQSDVQVNDQNLLTFGLGQIIETVEATRYEDKNRFDAGYFYFQHQWNPSDRFNMISGFRADLHSEYGGRISPKISAQYEVSEKLSVLGSIGSGFKAPDFRQLLLNFNNAAAGYYVFGSTIAEEGIQNLEEQGLISQILINPESIGELEAESSWAFNGGIKWTPDPRVSIHLNAYRNRIENLIETAPVARLVTGQNAFSYFNINSIVTQGIELDLGYTFRENLRFSLGYAFLDTRDLDVLDQIDAGKLFKRDESNITTLVTRSDYGGLFNRSRHSGNFKVNYKERATGINLALRGIYRGKFGFADLNGNLILDDPSEFADGWLSLNLTASKSFSDRINLEIGGTNLLNTQTPNQPNNPGRIIFAGINISIFEN